MKIKNRVYITTTTSVSCAGEHNQVLFHNILTGNTGIEKDEEYFFNALPALGKIRSQKTFFELLISQCENILESSHLNNYENTLLVIGSSVGGMKTTEDIYINTGDYANIDPDNHHIQVIANCLNETFNFYDDVSFSTACTSSANAIGYAYEVLSQGLYENVLVVGADSLSQTTVGGFLSLGVLSSAACRPFDEERDGMNVSEAIACLLIEKEAREESIEICGVGYSSDAHHMTHPKSKGEGAYRAMKRALQKANLISENIDYINAHGTGTQANDTAEGDAIVSLFSHNPFVSSTKSITGHTLGAAGALEAIISTMVLKKQTIPPNHFLEIPTNKVLNLTSVPKDGTIQYVMSNSFAFGGNNCSIIFGNII